jgi:hypothetical protein
LEDYFGTLAAAGLLLLGFSEIHFSSTIVVSIYKEAAFSPTKHTIAGQEKVCSVVE